MSDIDWQETALCREMPADMFFPEGQVGERGLRVGLRDAKQVCTHCDVRTQCLQYALDHDERFGVWGGLSERERRRLRKGAS